MLPTLDGVDDGLWALGALEARGVTVLNGAPALLAAHDKLLTARLLRRAGLPHPRTRLIAGEQPTSPLRPPVVVKPRFGSWGLGVERCDDEESLAALARQPARRAVVPRARGARPGARAHARLRSAHRRRRRSRDRRDQPRRRTRASGGRTSPSVPSAGRRRPPPDACALALAAARATGASLVGVDLLPDGRGRWTVAEINGAVEFTSEYALRARQRPVRRGRIPARAGRGLRQAPRARPGGAGAPRVVSQSPASRSSTPLLDCDAARLRDCSAA